MFKLTPLALLVTMLLCATGAHAQKMDTSDSTIDMYKNGTIKASYWVQVHKDPKAGQYWETEMKMEAAGMTMTTRWQVASVDGDTAIIEHQMKMDSQFMGSDYVLVYKVNLKAEAGEVNVTQAWIGKPGKEASKIEVMEKPEPVKGGDGAEATKPKEEEFKDLELAGKKWSGKLYTISGDGWEAKTWMADDGWFGGMVKSEAAGNVTQLKAQGEDAKALVTLPKEEKKEEEKKEEGKKDGSGK